MTGGSPGAGLPVPGAEVPMGAAGGGATMGDADRLFGRETTGAECG